MLYLTQTLFAPWLVAALALGIIIGWRSARKTAAGPRLGWLTAGAGIFVIALFVAATLAIPGRLGSGSTPPCTSSSGTSSAAASARFRCADRRPGREGRAGGGLGEAGSRPTARSPSRPLDPAGLGQGRGTRRQGSRSAGSARLACCRAAKQIRGRPRSQPGPAGAPGRNRAAPVVVPAQSPISAFKPAPGFIPRWLRYLKRP